MLRSARFDAGFGLDSAQDALHDVAGHAHGAPVQTRRGDGARCDRAMLTLSEAEQPSARI
jgi:hypothetical protein